MHQFRNPNLILPVTVILSVLSGLYAGAYYATIVPFPITEDGVIEAYRDPIWHGAGHRIFAPVHWLDRRLRPHVWEREVE